MRIARCIDRQGRIRWVEPHGEQLGQLIEVAPGLDDVRRLDERIEVQRWLAPVRPTDIYGIGLNYRAHAAETGAPIPENPVMFMKPSTAVTDPGEPILLPRACEHGPEVDYEAELAVVIGRTARDVSEADALDHVFGYTCANDVSARRWQKHAGGGQWVRGKSFDTFCPLGPLLVTADEIPDPQSLPIRSVLNGTTMQSSTTGDMIFSVAKLIAFISRDTTLLPGSVILTGTPEGVGFARKPPVYLSHGDTIEIVIDGIGTLRNPVRNA
ncbi:MAG: fumarylacetoacetate hydrolase family protein [Gammaproteobacteria bacterium]|nr:fumarylacetoacetate hydrolase family protein [Gammaproteobacteria bacterium]